MTEPKTAPCWWCGNPDTRVGYGMQPVGRPPPGARVECRGPEEEVCGTSSPYVWRNGRDLSEAVREAVKRHNAGPRTEGATRDEVEAALEQYEECADAHQSAVFELLDTVPTSTAYAARSDKAHRLGVEANAARERLFKLATRGT